MPITLRSDFTIASRGHGTCSICACNRRPLDSTDPNGPHERVLSTGIFIEFEGDFDICESCAREIAQTIGFVPKEYVEFAERDVLRWMGEAEKLAELVDEKSTIITALASELAGVAHKSATAYAAGYDAATEVEEEPDFA